MRGALMYGVRPRCGHLRFRSMQAFNEAMSAPVPRKIMLFSWQGNVAKGELVCVRGCGSGINGGESGLKCPAMEEVVPTRGSCEV